MAELYRSEICNVDIEKSLVRSYVGIVMATGDCLANRFGAVLRRNNDPVDVTGAAVNGYFIRPNGDTVVCPGVAEGDTVYVDLPAACYTQNGNFSLAIKVSSTDVTQTVRVVDGYIRQTQTETLIDPGEVVPSLDQLFAHIAEMETIVDQAQEIVDKAKTEVSSASAPAIVENASGAVATITDGAERPAQNIVSTIKAVQSGEGDPSPDNVRTISGWREVKVTRLGKNLVNIPDMENMQGNVIRAQAQAAFDAVPYKANTQYTFSTDIEMTATDANFGIEVKYSDGTTKYHWMYSKGNQTSKSVTIGTDGTIVSVKFSYDFYRPTTVRNVQIEEGTVATQYEPYQVVTLTATTPQVVYGGNLDWTTGVLTVTHVGKAVRATDISYKSTSASVNTSCFVTKPDTSLAVGRLTSLCSHFKNTMDTAYNAASARHGIFSDHPTQTTKYFAWGEPDATVTDFGNWLEEQYAAGTPVTVVYLLKEPRTVQLTSQQLDLLKGSNSVWSNTGDTALTFIADTKLYIDKVVAVLYEMFFNAIG